MSLSTPSGVFQFTHPGGVRHKRTNRLRGFCYVSIHAPGRGATTPSGISSGSDNRFNSRTREGCDLHGVLHLVRFRSFNSRTREGCDMLGLHRSFYDREFQFTHPGGVRPHTPCARICRAGVSIHAPGRGATPLGAPSVGRLLVSIHAPGRGATCSPYMLSYLMIVSIHAPGRGATCRGAVNEKSLGFNSRTREGCDFSSNKVTTNLRRFNSRTREGCDSTGSTRREQEVRFQFTHPGGVRLEELVVRRLKPAFQFTHPGGVRHPLRRRLGWSA